MRAFAATLLLSLCVPALSQTSFDQYFKANKQHQLGTRQANFVQACGLKQSDAQVFYGLSTEIEGFKFRRTPSLLQGRNEAETDFFGSAELWKIDGKPRFVSAWMLVMDVGSESNEMFCLDGNGSVTLEESLNALDAEVSGGAGWMYVERASYGADGTRKLVRSGYVHADGTRAATPKLKREDAEASKAGFDKSLASDVIAQLSR